MPELTINADDLRALVRSRESLLYGSLDEKRPRAWSQFGYPETLTPDRLLGAYLRGGPAFRAVHHVLDRCWQEWPRVKLKTKDKESPWETRLQGILEKVAAWPKLQDWDRRNMVGRYAGLILRVADGKQLREPLMRASRLVDLVPVYEHQIKVTAWDGDSSSETFGQPTMWQYRMRTSDRQDTQGKPEQWVDVHPSRILILAEGAVGDDFFDGIPLLQPGFNALVDLEKVSGGAAESFLKNSAGHLSFVFDKDADPTKLVAPKTAGEPVTPDDVRDVINDRADRVHKNIDSAIVGQGVTIGTLQTQMHDPRGAWEIAANTFAAAVGIPFTILFGQQTGRLASDEDKAADNARCKSRQRNLLTGAVTAVIRRLQACGIVEASDFEVEWAPLDAMGDDAKADQGGKMATINKDMVAAGRNAPFSENEIRKVLGYEEEAELDDMPGEGDPDDDDTDPLPARDEPPQQRPAAQPAANDGGGLLQRMARAVRGVTTNADEPRTISPNPEANETMRLARQYLAEGRTVELSLRVEAAPAAPTIQVAAPNVTVEAPRITVEAPNVAVTNNVQPTDVTVQVAAPVVTVEAQLPDVNVTLDMPPRTSTTILEYNDEGNVKRAHTVEGARKPD